MVPDHRSTDRDSGCRAATEGPPSTDGDSSCQQTRTTAERVHTVTDRVHSNDARMTGVGQQLEHELQATISHMATKHDTAQISGSQAQQNAVVYSLIFF